MQWLGRRGSIALSIVLAVGGGFFLAGRGSEDRRHDGGSITVVHGTALTALTAMTTGRVPLKSGVQTSSPLAADDVALMEEDMAAAYRDQRTTTDEVRLRDILKTTLPSLRSSMIACAGLTCRISGEMPNSVNAARGYIQSVSFFDAIFALGYSPGPDRLESQGADTSVLFYLRRDH